MRFRKIALALFACLALGAFAANAARAAGTGWTTSSGLVPNGTHLPVNCAKHGTSTLIFTSTLLGEPVELSATGVDCVEARIDNTTTPGHSEGKLRFTGVTVLKPSTKCTVGNLGESSSGVVTTALLTDTVIMDPKSGSTGVFDRFFSDSGPWFTIEFGGALCPLAEASAPVKGSACGEAVHTNAGGTAYEANKTGELKVVHTLLFGKAQQETGNSASEPCALTLGTNSVQIAGAVDNELASKATFGAD